MNLMTALKTTPMLSAQSSPEASVTLATLDSNNSAKKFTKKKKEDTASASASQQSQQSDSKSKPLSRKNVLVVPGLIPNYPGVQTIEAGVIEQQMSIKDEPIESVDPNVLLPQVVKNVKSPTLMHHLAEDRIKMEVKSPPPPKSSKKGKTKQSPAEQGMKGSRSPPIRTEPGESGKGSVIKMLLNKPTQFSDPKVSTQSLTKSTESGASPPKSESKGKKGLKVKKELAPEMLKVDTGIVKKEDVGMVSPGARETTSGMMSPSRMQKLSSPMNDVDDDDDDDDLDDVDLDEEDDLDPSIDDSMEWEFETQDGSLIIAEENNTTPQSKKKTKKPTSTKKAKMKSSNIDTTQNGYAKSPTQKGVKKKKRLTAYTMWCNSMRNKVLNDNPGMDFAHLSRRLGEIWQTVPSKEKQNWKRKAKREARKLLGKGLLIQTGKQETGATAAKKAEPSATITTSPPSHVPPAAQPSTSHNPPPIIHAPIRGKGSHSVRQLASVQRAIEEAQQASRHLGIEPIDTAAHLKLVGDSLSIIGMRLQEHRGLIAVQGSLSVLLDSMLCALGPLLCLTTQVPELDGCPAETHVRTLDNIAYIMPGL
ncbi:hypothetical protein FSP39_008975 [Pinctada imbricata]|uniref:HMG box domain-containing protein n=1 Tax=Pinctada imbricata TaxID=66713 RepID=A0AA88XPZ2_PINIB|nr:hypothetical protein FSP39_008975 [Pinctada imbricata]